MPHREHCRKRVPSWVALMIAALVTAGCEGYRRDGNGVNWVTVDEGRGRVSAPIEGADGASFVVLADGYAKDRWRAYFNGRAMNNGKPFNWQPTAFRSLGGGYAVDESLAYYDGIEFHADAATLRLCHGGQCATDRNDAYVGRQAVHACDPASFHSDGDDRFRDDRCAYAVARDGRITRR